MAPELHSFTQHPAASAEASPGRLPAGARRRWVLDLVAARGFAAVGAIAANLGVSEMTVRRDLAELERSGKVMRTRGGALSPEGPPREGREPAFAARASQQNAAKLQIATAALPLALAARTVALDIGSTTYLLARRLLGETPGVRVFTSSLRAAVLLSESRHQVYLPGGAVHGDEPSVSGPEAVAHFERLWFDVAFIGVAGLTPDGLFDYSPEDAELKRLYLRRAARRVLLCDASKFNHVSLVQVAPLDSVDLLITDAAPQPTLAAAIAAAGVELRLAAAPEQMDH